MLTFPGVIVLAANLGTNVSGVEVVGVKNGVRGDIVEPVTSIL